MTEQQPLSFGKRRRLEKRRDAMQKEWDIRHQKIERITRDLAIETSPTTRYQLEQQLQHEEAERRRLGNELDEIDLKLQSSNTSTNPNNAPTFLSSQPQPLPNLTRRRVIEYVGLAGAGFAGFGTVHLLTRLLQTQQPDQSPQPLQTRKRKPTRSPQSLPTQAQQPVIKKFKYQTVTVNTQGSIIDRSDELEANYFVEDLGNNVTLEMVQIPGGKFLMGSPAEEKARGDDEAPQHEVTVADFFMGKYPVTQAQYQAVMGENPSKFKGQQRPVEQVSWNDAIKFCEELSRKTGRTYRLPSEAQWEYAARAETTTPFYFGETITTDLANYNGNYTYGSEPKGQSRQYTIDVGKFPPNSFGLYDMCGNAYEWCLDKYHDNYKGAPTNGSPWLESSSDSRVMRSGSWMSGPKDCRSANRGRNNRSYRNFNVGFRLVLVA